MRKIQDRTNWIFMLTQPSNITWSHKVIFLPLSLKNLLPWVSISIMAVKCLFKVIIHDSICGLALSPLFRNISSSYFSICKNVPSLNPLSHFNFRETHNSTRDLTNLSSLLGFHICLNTWCRIHPMFQKYKNYITML